MFPDQTVHYLIVTLASVEKHCQPTDKYSLLPDRNADTGSKTLFTGEPRQYTST